METETRGSRCMFLVLTRPSTVFMMSVFSRRPIHMVETWGAPSDIIVAREAMLVSSIRSMTAAGSFGLKGTPMCLAHGSLMGTRAHGNCRTQRNLGCEHIVEHDMTNVESRGRPLGFKPDSALDQLMGLFWEQGYDHTSQADMIERTGLSSSSLYNTFGDKLAIFDAVLARYNDLVDANCAPMFDRADGLEAIKIFIDRLVEHVAQPRMGARGCLIVATMAEAGDELESVSDRVDYYRSHIQEAMAASISRAQQAGKLTPGDAGDRAAILFSMYVGVMATSRVDPASASRMAKGMKQVVGTWAS